MGTRLALYILLFLAMVGTILAEVTAYDILIDGKVCGSCSIEINKRGGGYFIRKTATVAEKNAEKIISEEIIVDNDWLPETYSLTVTSPEENIRITGAFSGKSVEFSGKVGMGEMNKVVEAEENISVWSEQICMTSPLLLLARMDYSVIGQSADFSVAIPEKMEPGIVTLTVSGQEDGFYVVNGQQPGGWQFEARFDPVKNFIKEFDIKGGYEARVSTGEKPTGVGEIPKGYHPITPMILADKEYIERLENVKSLTSSISFSFPPGVADRLYLNNFSQEFAGEITSSSASGTIETKKIGHKVTNAPDWPLYYPLKGVDERYTMPERGVDSDDPDIIARAKSIVKPAVTLWDAARAINLWVYRNIKYDMVTGNASEVFTAGKSDSRGKALLCAAMCRAVGIPARIVSGVLWAEGATDHTWVEVYLGEKVGWGPLDPTLNEADKINGAHISLWLGAQEPPVYAKDMAFENTVISD
ncbi:hypothetical protein DRQ36_01855 [bacterium]|nr:MAG: hypothetical protein DRQ36_01855 [bacterium]